MNRRIRTLVVIGAVLSVVSMLGSASRAEAFIYWTAAGGIGRANVDGSDTDGNFITTTEAPTAVAVDPAHVYWTYFTGDVLRAGLDGGGAEVLFNSPQNGYMSGLAVDPDHVYWSEFQLFGGSVGRADLDGGNVEPNLVTSSRGDPEGVAVDRSHFYWTDQEYGTIGRADLDGSHARPWLITGTSASKGIAVDAHHLYWANRGTIARARLDGTHVRQDFIDTPGSPWGVAVDAGHIYWADHGAGEISRADLDGTHVDDTFISGISEVTDVAVDARSYPETTITAGPRGVTRDSSPRFAFTGDPPGSTFECSLGGAVFSRCRSPKSYEDLPDGPNSFAVRATSPADQTDPSPAVRNFIVDTKVKGGVAAKRAQKQRDGKIRVLVEVRAKEHLDATARGEIRLKKPGNGRCNLSLRPVEVSVAAHKRKTLKLRVESPENRRRTVKALKDGRRLATEISVKLVDGAGNGKTEKVSVKLKP